MQTFPFKTNVFALQDNPPRTASLYGDRYADVVIVGGGIVGLSCAHTLRAVSYTHLTLPTKRIV